MSKYTNKTNVQNYLKRDLEETEDALIESVIQSISNFINDKTGRLWADIKDDGTFEEVNDSVRYYDGSGHDEIFIDDFVSATSIQRLSADGSVYDTLTTDDYILYPLNSTYKNSIAKISGRFNNQKRSVKVTAKFVTGLTVPSEIIMTATALVADYLVNFGKANGFKKESIEGYSYELMGGSDLNEVQDSRMKIINSWRKNFF